MALLASFNSNLLPFSSEIFSQSYLKWKQREHHYSHKLIVKYTIQGTKQIKLMVNLISKMFLMIAYNSALINGLLAPKQCLLEFIREAKIIITKIRANNMNILDPSPTVRKIHSFSQHLSSCRTIKIAPSTRQEEGEDSCVDTIYKKWWRMKCTINLIKSMYRLSAWQTRTL